MIETIITCQFKLVNFLLAFSSSYGLTTINKIGKSAYCQVLSFFFVRTESVLLCNTARMINRHESRFNSKWYYEFKTSLSHFPKSDSHHIWVKTVSRFNFLGDLSSWLIYLRTVSVTMSGDSFRSSLPIWLAREIHFCACRSEGFQQDLSMHSCRLLIRKYFVIRIIDD